MYVVCVTVFVKPEKVNDFIQASKDNAGNTLNEPGNLRFDVLQAVDEPAKFFLYEVYRSEEDFKSHQQTEHYLRWRETVADMMAQPRQGVKHYSVFPKDEDW
jgi:autoinducer 2-degrading protein